MILKDPEFAKIDFEMSQRKHQPQTPRELQKQAIYAILVPVSFSFPFTGDPNLI